MTRKPIIAGNWKMHNNCAQSKELIKGIKEKVDGLDIAKLPEIVVAPVFTSLGAVNEEICHCGCGRIKLAAQNVYFEPKGAFTGEISIDMLKDFEVSYIIIGHSERRQYFGETDEMINKKAKVILDNGIIPIICCGETLEQREQGVTDAHIAKQISEALKGLSAEEVAKSVIAYEPIWAIGTGKTATSDQAEEICAVVRKTVADLYDQGVADKVRIQYGGSVKPANVKELMAKPNIDGGLVGGASLVPESYLELVNFND